MSDTDPAVENQKPWQFRPGQSGNPAGRPKGSRNRHSENFLREFSDDFEQHGRAVIEKVRLEQPATYLRIAADLLPRESTLDVNVDILHDVTSTIEAFRAMSEMLGADPQRGLQRLRKLAPMIEHDERR
jgi:hypothetical protein